MIEMRWIDRLVPRSRGMAKKERVLQYRQWISQGREFWTEWTDVPFVGVEDE